MDYDSYEEQTEYEPLACPVCGAEMVKAQLKSPGPMNTIYLELLPQDEDDPGSGEKREVEVTPLGLDAWLCLYCGHVTLHIHALRGGWKYE